MSVGAERRWYKHFTHGVCRLVPGMTKRSLYSTSLKASTYPCLCERRMIDTLRFPAAGCKALKIHIYVVLPLSRSFSPRSLRGLTVPFRRIQHVFISFLFLFILRLRSPCTPAYSVYPAFLNLASAPRTYTIACVI